MEEVALIFALGIESCNIERCFIESWMIRYSEKMNSLEKSKRDIRRVGRNTYALYVIFILFYVTDF